MKTLLVVLAVLLVVCEGYIPEYRRSKSKSNRYVEEDSYEDDYDDNSMEEMEEDSAPRTERRMRASVQEPSYGYSKSYKRKDDREYGGKTRKPSYSDKKSRAKYQVYEKTPHRTFKKDIVSRQSSAAAVRGRKKDHRSAPVYESTYHYPSPLAPYSSPPPAAPHHKPAPPKAQCSHQLMISCTPTVTKVPCGAYAGGHHPTPVPPAPQPAYQERPSYHTPPPAYNPPAFSPQLFNPPVHTPPAAQYLPQPKPLYHHHTAQPQPEPVHQPHYQQPGQHPYYQQPKPTPHFAAPPAYHQPYQPYQPTYKSMEATPSFAAPVSEDHQEPAHHPVISAFPATSTTTSTTTQHVPTTSTERHQNAGSHTHRPAAGGAEEEAHNQGEASGDEAEGSKPRVASTQDTTTSSPTTSSTTATPEPSTTVEIED